ncbi:ABC transporter substrate-binding protein [Pseudonocardia yunnanensis]|uniref:ABC transporter substrate-binding protein n=1 Tax=Pseudonocardia yunnanensis TaxID=58107 RepID=A0ABW4FC68_9PSEU
MHKISRRALLGGVLGAAGLVGLSACAGVGGRSGTASTVRYAMWGNNVRQQNYQQAFTEMQQAVQGLTIALEFAEYTAFQERMTTQMAAGTVADVFWVPSPNVMTYYANDLYRPLSQIENLDLSDYPAEDLTGFELDGQLNTLPFAIFVPVVRYNATFAEQDGVEPPADWTWQTLAEFAKDYSANNSQGRKALANSADTDLGFEYWLRQRGEQLWTQDGKVGFTQDGLASWLDYWEDLRKAGATTTLSEQDGVTADWPTIGDRVLMVFGNSNHIIDDAPQFPDYRFALRHPPVAADATADFRYLYYPRMAISQNAADETLELAGQVLNYCVNRVEMLKTVGLTMGAPTNPRVAGEMEQFASPDEKETLRVVAEDRAAPRAPRFEAPAGSGSWRTTMTRTIEDIALGNTPVPAAAGAMITEINDAIARAQ